MTTLKINIKATIFAVLALCFVTNVFAAEDSTAEAELLMKSGETQSAVAMLNRLEKKFPKNGKINMLLGDCYLQQDSTDKAKQNYRVAIKKGENDAWLSFASLATLEYRISDAEEDIELYRKGLKKGRKTLPDESADIVAQLEKTRNMLDRVEKIVIIDSINVDAENFFTHYKLSPESGSLLPPEMLPDDVERAYPTAVYASESGNELMWAAPDSTQTFRLVETAMLYAGEWELPRQISSDLGQGGDANFPFLLQDGITLYYANNSENSLGGYDIYISRKNGNEFLQPQNIGMPYNSPYNDYMLAIDETTGVGWWATDRNKIPGMVTIYVFIPGDMRINYDVDDQNLASYARIDSYKATWEEGADYSNYLEAIAAIKPAAKQKNAVSFMLSVPGKGVYTSLDDFKSQEARKEMERYLSDSRAVTQANTKLRQLRLRYSKGEKNLGNEILAWEARISNMKKGVKDSKNKIIKLEQSY